MKSNVWLKSINEMLPKIFPIIWPTECFLPACNMGKARPSKDAKTMLKNIFLGGAFSITQQKKPMYPTFKMGKYRVKNENNRVARKNICGGGIFNHMLYEILCPGLIWPSLCQKRGTATLQKTIIAGHPISHYRAKHFYRASRTGLLGLIKGDQNAVKNVFVRSIFPMICWTHHFPDFHGPKQPNVG